MLLVFGRFDHRANRKTVRSGNIIPAETDRIAKLTSHASRTLIVLAKLAVLRPELVRLDIKRAMNLHGKISIGLLDSGADRHK